MARLPAARGPARPPRRPRRRPLVPPRARPGRPGAAQPRAACAVALDAIRARRARRSGRPPTDPRALERLVRSCVPARRPLLPRGRADARRSRPATSDERLVVETPELVAEAFVPGGRSSSSASTSARSSCRRSSWPSGSASAVAPMETIDDPALQAYFVRTRGAAGVRHRRPARGAPRAARRAPRRHPGRARRRPRPDRRRHRRSTLFGAPADAAARPGDARGGERRAALRRRRPARPGVGRYRGRLEPIAVPAEGIAPRARDGDDDRRSRPAFERHRRGRARAVVGGLLPDLAGPRGRPRATAGTPEARRDRAGRGRADLHIHTLASRRHGRRRGDPRPRRAARPTSTSSRSPTTSGSTRPSPRGRWPRDRGLPRRGRRRRGGHDPRRPPAGAVHRAPDPAVPLAARRRSPRSTTRAAWPSRPTRSCPTRCAPRAGSCAGCSTTRTRRVHPDALETFNPTALGRPWHERVVRFADEHGLARVGNSDAHALDGDRDAAGRRSRAGRRRTCGAAIARRHDRPRRHVPRDRRPARHVRAAAAQARPRRPRRGRRAAPPRRDRPRPRLSRRPAAAAALRAAGRAIGRRGR